jgi:long-chain acyl-CoA synthetase
VADERSRGSGVVTSGPDEGVRIPGSSLPALLVARSTATPGRVAWRQLTHGVWTETVWAQLEARAAAYASGFAASGIAPGSRVAMIVGPGLEAAAAATGLLGLGAIVVSLHPGRHGADLGAPLAGVRIAIAEDVEQLASVLALRETVRDLGEVFVVDARGVGGSGGSPPLADVAARAHDAERGVNAWRESVRALAPDAAALVALTVGGSGASRPVVLTHSNLVAATRALAEAVPVRPDDEILSYLPPSHVLERVLSTGVAPLVGAVVNVGDGPDEVLSDLRQVRPTVLLGVPGLWDRVVDRLDERRSNAGWLKRTVLDRGLRRGHRRLDAWRGGTRPGLLAGRLSTRPARARLGLDRTRAALSALAPLADETADALGALGLVVRQCYGTAEASGLLTMEPVDAVRPGSVGRPVSGTDVREDERGELLARGPQIAPAQQDDEGWLHTGDRARIDDESLVRLEGRVEDVIVTATGAHVDAAAVATALGKARLVRRVVVTGDGRSSVGALLELDPVALRSWAVERSAPFSGTRDLLAWPELRRELERNIADANDVVPPDSQVHRFRVLPGPLVPDAELTGTRRLRRAAAIRANADLVDEMYRA